MILSEPKRKKRIASLLLLFAVLFLALIVRVFFLQIIQGSELQQRALSQWTTTNTIEAKRGSITDRNGEILAQSGSAETVVVRPATIAASKEYADPAAVVADRLAEVLHMDRDTIYGKASDTSKMEIWIKRQVTREQADAIRELDLPGVAFVVETKRYYPKLNFLTQVLGYTSIDGVGQEGIESYYNKYLSGEDGKISVITDERGNEIAFGEEIYVEETDGYDVALTVDYVVQSILEKCAEDAYDKYQAAAVMAVAMNPQTGEILGLTIKDDFDLNEVPRDNLTVLAELSRNRIVTDANDPGSVFKVFTTAAALEEGAVTTASTFVCNGGRHVGSDWISCHSKTHTGTLTLADALAKSCNPCFVDMALEIGTETMYDYIYRFGFGQKTGVEVYGESAGIILHQKYVTPAILARIGFGQSISTTPLQTITAFCSLINGGTLYQPSLVHSITTQDGEVIRAFTPEGTQVLSKGTSDTMRELLQSVVADGSGSKASVAGYEVGGKTGTAQKYDENGKVKENLHYSSFIGYAGERGGEAEIAVLFIVDEATTGGSDYGSVIAAPYVGQILSEVASYYGMEAQYTEEELKVLGTEVEMKDLIGQSRTEAEKALRALGLKANFVGNDSGVVIAQTVAPNTKIYKGSTVTITLGTPEDLEPKYSVVPDLTGLTPDECLQRLEALGFEMFGHGTGTAFWQTPKAGTTLEQGSTVKVEFGE